MSFFPRFLSGVVIGFNFASIPSSLCSPIRSDAISSDGLSNYALYDMPIPLKDELEYVKTWGVRWVDDWDRPDLRRMNSDGNRLYKRQLLLIRHGQYMNETSHDDGVRVLTSVGEEQAKITGKYLLSLFQQFLYDNPSRDGNLSNHKSGIVVAAEPKFVHVSDMTRAKQTAKYILDAFPSHIQNRQTTDPGLRERFPCDPEPPLRHRHAKYSDMRAAEDVFDRYFHRPLTRESSVEIIVGHANVIRYLVCRALQLPPEAWLRISLPHCSITSVIISGNGHVRVTSIGSAGHLPADKVTTHNLP